MNEEKKITWKEIVYYLEGYYKEAENRNKDKPS